MNKELRLTIYQAMLDILEGVVKIETAVCNDVCVDVNDHSFFLVCIHSNIYCKSKTSDDNNIIYGFCSILHILREAVPELSDYYTSLKILKLLDELQPYFKPPGYWFDPSDRKSRINLLKKAIKTIHHDKD